MFQFPRFASASYVFRYRYHKSGGFSHSEIRGSKDVDSSPRLIAACHVLHRLSVPRHPLNALLRLIYTQLKCFCVSYKTSRHTSPKIDFKSLSEHIWQHFVFFVVSASHFNSLRKEADETQAGPASLKAKQLIEVTNEVILLDIFSLRV